MNTGMNVGDPGQASQMWNLQQLMQTAASQGWAGAMAMNRSKQQSQTLEALLSSISQQPEVPCLQPLSSEVDWLGASLSGDIHFDASAAGQGPAFATLAAGRQPASAAASGKRRTRPPARTARSGPGAASLWRTRKLWVTSSRTCTLLLQ